MSVLLITFLSSVEIGLSHLKWLYPSEKNGLQVVKIKSTKKPVQNTVGNFVCHRLSCVRVSLLLAGLSGRYGFFHSVPHEIAVKWYEMIQTGLPMCAMSSIVAPLRLTAR